MVRFLKALSAVCAVLYPLLILWALSSFREHVRSICLVALPLIAIVCLVKWGKSRKPGDIVLPAIAMLLFGAVALTDSPQFFKLYPILVSGLMLMQFGGSLLSPPCVVERFALLGNKGKPLDEATIAYCRKVTIVWVAFFCVNIMISAATAFLGSWEVWAWYNGCISYVLIGVIMACEWCTRRIVQQRNRG